MTRQVFLHCTCTRHVYDMYTTCIRHVQCTPVYALVAGSFHKITALLLIKRMIKVTSYSGTCLMYLNVVSDNLYQKMKVKIVITFNLFS